LEVKDTNNVKKHKISTIMATTLKNKFKMVMAVSVAVMISAVSVSWIRSDFKKLRRPLVSASRFSKLAPLFNLRNMALLGGLVGSGSSCKTRGVVVSESLLVDK
jgi:hypothetical protein